MSLREMGQLIGKAIVSDTLREGLLGSRRAELLKDFDFSKEEQEFLLGIQAETFAEFAQVVDNHISSRLGERPSSATKK